MSRDYSESELARAVVAELQAQGYETYEEVEAARGAARADIVGLRGPLVVIVECKVSMGLAVLEQCVNWRGSAHMVIAATGYSRTNRAADRLMRFDGIGHWRVGSDAFVREDIAPRLHRKADVARLRARCLPENKTGGMFAQAGSTTGGHFTPFRATAMALREIVSKQPGLSLRDALAQTKHHYSSAKSAMSSLPGLIRSGVVQGVRLEVEGRALKLYPVAMDNTRRPA